MSHFGLNLNEAQKKKFDRAVSSGSEFSTRMAHEALGGIELKFATPTQQRKLNRATKRGSGFILNLSPEQIKQMTSIAPEVKSIIKSQ